MKIVMIIFAFLISISARAGYGENTKKGLLIGNELKAMDYATLISTLAPSGLDDPVNNWGAGWFYSYNIHPGDAVLQWAGEAEMRFVMMQTSSKVRIDPDLPEDGTNVCYLLDRDVRPGFQKCTKGQYRTALNIALNDMDLYGVRLPIYFLGFNEPYHESTNYTPNEAIEIWTKYLEPLVYDEKGINLISPTTKSAGGDNTKFNWLVDFLGFCHIDSACTVDKIRKIALHEYNCSESFWQNNYGGSNQYRLDLRYNLNTRYPGYNWDDWVNTRELWVTETNCNQGGPAATTNKETCLMATGNMEGYGQGSLKTLEEISDIERVFWWTSYNTDTATSNVSNARLLKNNGNITKAGQGYKLYNPVGSTPATVCD